ncbi:MAG: hypothetical protein R3C14_36565 [Caldilineaceae bacterium]
MNTKQSPTLLQRLATNYVVSLLLWLVAVGLTALDILYGRLLTMAFFGLFALNHWVMSFIDRAGIFLLGLAGLILVLFLEHYYRTGVQRNRLWPRFLRVSAYQLVIILAGMALSWFQF